MAGPEASVGTLEWSNGVRTKGSLCGVKPNGQIYHKRNISLEKRTLFKEIAKCLGSRHDHVIKL